MSVVRRSDVRILAAGVRRNATAALACAVLLIGSAPAAAQTVLTLSRGPGSVETLELTLDQLAVLPQVTIVTENAFADGMVSYRGPLVRDVIEQLALGEAEALRFTALNDFYVEIPTSDFRRYAVILALEADGKRLSRREKGPLWLMYPISDHRELRDPLYTERLIWQVVMIESI